MESESLREKILEEIRKTEKLVDEYRDMVVPMAPDSAIGRVSRMDAINNRSVTESALRQAEEKFQKLNFVLSKVGSSDFGICIKCKSPIPLGRILIRPESIHCVNCAR
jgi:DnaK suppressor protein